MLRIAFPVLLCAAALIAYANSFAGVFLFDDVIRIVEEERIRRLWPIGPLLSGERPVVDLTLALNYALGGLNPWGYHALNLAVHALAGLTLFGIVRRTITRTLKFKVQRSKRGDTTLSSREEYGNSREQFSDGTTQQLPDYQITKLPNLCSFAIALLFLVHPLQTQSVTYIIQRGESMMGLFYLLTVYCAIRAWDRPAPWALAAVVACGLGMATKAVMVTAPVMVILYDWVFGKAKIQSSKFKERCFLYAGLAATWVVLWLCGIGPEVLGASNPQSHVGFSYQGLTPSQYALTQPGVMVKYLQLAIWPANLCLDYDWPVAQGWREIVLPSIFIAALLAATLYLLWRRHWLGFCGAWFFLILAPTSSFIPIKDLIFEHRMYLPLAGVIAAIIVPLCALMARGLGNGEPFQANRPSKASFAASAAIAGLAFALAAPLAYATRVRNRDYHSELTMWQDVVSNRPLNARAHVGIGVEYLENGKADDAIPWLQKAIALKYAYADAHFNLGLALAAIAEHRKALESLGTALQLNPRQVGALIQSATSLERLGELELARKYLIKAIQLRPQEADYHYRLGNLLLDSGDDQGALVSYQAALRMNPAMVPAIINLGNLLLKEGKVKEAQEKYEQALKHESANSAALVSLGRALFQQHKWADSIAAFERVRMGDPLEAEARFGAGWALLQLGRVEDARKNFRETLRLDPNHAAAATHLMQLESQKQ